MRNQLKILIALILISVSCQPKKMIESNFYQTKTLGEFIYAKSIHSDMDYSEFQNRRSILLDVVSQEEDGEALKKYWNYNYYRFFPHHFIASDSIVAKLAEVLEIPAKDFNELVQFWPTPLKEEAFNKLVDSLDIHLVEKVNTPEKFKNKYVITPNLEFWDYQYRDDYNLLIDITSTYEREFEDFELIHNTKEDALHYGIIIFDRLCVQRNPDNSYYYSKLVIDQFPQCETPYKEEFAALNLSYYDGLPIMGFDIRKYSTEDKRKEYERIIVEKKADLELTKKIFTHLPKPPFKITKIK